MKIKQEIRRLQNELRRDRGDRAWTLHNRLRHLNQLLGDHPEALRHANAILGFSPMDDYILSTLSGWQRDNPDLWGVLAA